MLPGGAGRFALETANELSSRGWQVHIASIRANQAIVGNYKNINFHCLGGPLSSSVLYWVYLPILLIKVFILTQKIKPTVLFSQVFPANWWGFIVKLILGKSVSHVWMCQEPSAFIHSSKWLDALPMSVAGILARILNPILKPIDVFLSKYKDLVFANSNFSKLLAINAYDYSTAEVGICYPGVDLNRFKSIDVNRTKYQFITCCRLTKFKNIDLVIKSFAKLANNQINLIIIGDGEEYQNLVNLAESLKLNDKVTFCKTVTDNQMVELLQKSFALIHPAEEEPFGLVPVEAMACGTPVIAIKDGGPGETVIHQKTGYLCNRASLEELEEAILWLISRDDFNSLSLECKNRALLFTWKQAVDTLESAFLNRRL